MPAVTMVQAEHEEEVEVRDLGSFSMETIYEALVKWTGDNNGSYGRTVEFSINESRHERDDRGEESDCSWTHAEDNGTFYADMEHQLDEFVLNTNQTTMTTALLLQHQRRVIHARAQVMGLGHASLGAQGRHRRMVVFKHNASSVVSKVQEVAAHAVACADSELAGANPVLLEALPMKRRRLEKVDGGFPCQYGSCFRVFDRASERTKHEQTHQPTFTNRFQCPQCEKGFRYPKDLRRHQRVHGRARDRRSLDQAIVSVESTPSTSMLTSDSRVPSETSLTFSSNTVSNDNSPFLAAWNGMPQTEIEPLVLEKSASSHSRVYGNEDWDMPFRELLDLQYDDADGCDDGFLIMAKTRA